MELSKSKANVISSLSSKKMRIKHGLFLAEGEKCVLDMLDAYQVEYIVATPEWIERNIRRLKIPDTQIFEAHLNDIRKMSSLSTPSQVMAIFKMPGNEMPEIKQDKLYLLLDGVQDPGNLGTIIRTYDWFGVDTIFASDSTVDVFNPKTVQSTMGSLKRVEVHYTDLGRLIERYPDMPVYGTVLDGRNIYKMNLKDFGFIVMGNEGNGITDSIKNKIKIPLLIPPYDKDSHAESLNVAIATAVVLSTFRFG